MNGTPETIVYSLGGALYLNITNQCTMACTFCPKRHGDYSLGPYDLKLGHTPAADEIIAELATHTLTTYAEVVFVGLGEPTRQLDTLLHVAQWLKERGCTVRVNTDGLANLVSGRDVTPDMAGRIDILSVSLNAPDPVTHAQLCPSQYKTEAHPAVVDFIRKAKAHIPQVVASVVAVPGLDLEACATAAQELGVPLKVRPYNMLGPEKQLFAKSSSSNERDTE